MTRAAANSTGTDSGKCGGPKTEPVSGDSPSAQPASKQMSEKDPRYCWWVRFHPKRDQNDQDKVPLGVNGVFLNVARGVEVPLPNFMLESAEHATHRQYRTVPTSRQPLKVVAHVSRFTYERIRPATWQEYQDFLAKGNEQQKRELAAQEAAEMAATAGIT